MLRLFSGEPVLRWMPNGGVAVALRSAWTSVFLYGMAISLKAAMAPGHEWSFDLTECRSLVSETIPWLGAIFAGSYVALYTRFASQWAYLSEVYNQIMAAAVQNPPAGVSRRPKRSTRGRRGS